MAAGGPDGRVCIENPSPNLYFFCLQALWREGKAVNQPYEVTAVNQRICAHNVESSRHRESGNEDSS